MTPRTPRQREIRHASLRSGLITLVAVAVFFAAVLNAGVLQDLFRSELNLRVILSEEGLSGLSSGAQVEILGTSAGRVDHVVLDPDAAFYAVVRIDKAMEPFVRADSRVYVRKQFGIAGAAYLEITRGRGEPLDWDFAVLEATREAAPTASVGELIDELRNKIFPVIDQSGVAMRETASLVAELNRPQGNVRGSLADLSKMISRISEGEGNLGRLMRDDTLVRDLEQTVAQLKGVTASVTTVMANLETTTSHVSKMTSGFARQSERLPEMIEQTNATLASLNEVMAEVSRTMPEVTNLVRSTAESSTALPTLLAQTQQTLSELEKILVQLQGSWLLGGGGGGETRPAQFDRLSPIEGRQ